MITIKIIGGLGNQMFQYATAKSLAEINHTELQLDLSWFEDIPKGCTPRKFELECFGISGNIPHLTSPRRGGIEQLFDKFRPWSKKKFYQEPYFHFDPKFFRLGKNVYLQGYFQSEKYFVSELEKDNDIKGVIDSCLRRNDKNIRNIFVFKNPQEGRNLEVAEMIMKSNSVSLHIRRGDYVSDTKTNQFHGVCDLEYYRRCIAEIEKNIPEPHFFIFSDDMNWVKENLKINHPAEYVDHNTGEKSYEDMRLMSQCKHNVIANSSFSWWGAWLNPNPEKIVFAPQRWFADNEQNTKYLIPEGWRKK